MAEQGSQEWLMARVGKVTASRIGDLMAKGAGTTRANYMAELCAERLTGQPYEAFVPNKAMEHGTEAEPRARAEYEFAAESPVVEVGFVPHPVIPMTGASPDGLVGDDGMVEFKCPNTATHIKTLLGGSIKLGYLYQMQWGINCAERKWCDFVSFDDRLPPNRAMHITRVAWDEDMSIIIETAVKIFLAELDAMVEQLR